MKTRTLHRIIGKLFAPFFIIASLTAFPLFWRHDGVYSESTKELLVSIHTWEVGAKYCGIILAFALLFMAGTGLVLAFGGKKDNRAVRNSNK